MPTLKRPQMLMSMHEKLLAAARMNGDDVGGTSLFIGLVLLRRSFPSEVIVASITAAPAVGAVTR